MKDVHPTVRVRLNDVSLTSCSLGALATGVEFPIRFRGWLAFMEDALAVRVAPARKAQSRSASPSVDRAVAAT
jgi:hypothetical protein